MVLVRSCRRDIFLVAPERCNKGNRRRLHAGKYLTTTHHLTARRSERRSEMAEPRKACPMIDPLSGSLQRVRLIPNGKFLPMILVMESGYVARQTPLLYMFLCT